VEPPRPSPAGAAAKAIDPADRAALAREIQRELRRVGCYSGEVNGVWTTSSRMAMKTFVDRVNAALPIDNPDPVLLSLVQGHRDRACGVCPPGQAATATACVPKAVLTTAAPADARPEADKPGDAATAAGAAALALTTPSAVPKPDPPAADPRTGPGAAHAVPAASTPAPPGAPVQPDGAVRERRPRQPAEAAPRPPKVVRDVLKVLGF
jgi:hypothetical protein